MEEFNNIEEGFKFLNEDKDKRLLPLISNYLALGQFELARGKALKFFFFSLVWRINSVH